MRDLLKISDDAPAGFRDAVEAFAQKILPQYLAVGADGGGRPQEGLDRRLLARRFAEFRKQHPRLTTKPALERFIRTPAFQTLKSQGRVSAKEVRSLVAAERKGRVDRAETLHRRHTKQRYLKAASTAVLLGRPLFSFADAAKISDTKT